MGETLNSEAERGTFYSFAPRLLSTKKSGLSVFANLLDRGHNIGIRSAAADVAAHQFLH